MLNIMQMHLYKCHEKVKKSQNNKTKNQHLENMTSHWNYRYV